MTLADSQVRHTLLRRGFALEYATLAWNVIGIVVLAIAAQERRRCSHDSAVSIEQLVRLQRILRGHHTPDTRHPQCDQITLMRLNAHEQRP